MSTVFGPYARVIRSLLRAVSPSWQVQGDLPAGPAVLLVHHQNLFGPVCAEALLPEEPHIWVLEVFHSREACFRQFYSYTFSQRFGWPAPAAALAAGALSLVVPPLIRSVQAIPVYRGHKEILETMAWSIQALRAGRKVLICPDMDYASSEADVGSIYTGFLHLEKEWHREGRAPLPFVPLYCSRSDRILAIGEALCFPRARPFNQERDEMARRLRDRMNDLGRLCGDLS